MNTIEAFDLFMVIVWSCSSILIITGTVWFCAGALLYITGVQKIEDDSVPHCDQCTNHTKCLRRSEQRERHV